MLITSKTSLGAYLARSSRHYLLGAAHVLTRFDKVPYPEAHGRNRQRFRFTIKLPLKKILSGCIATALATAFGGWQGAGSA